MGQAVMFIYGILDLNWDNQIRVDHMYLQLGSAV